MRASPKDLPDPFPFRTHLERSVLVVLLAATAANLLLVARNGLTPSQGPTTFGLVFWQWHVVLYALAALPGLAALGMLGRLRSTALLPRALLALVAIGFVAVASLQNLRSLNLLFDLDGPSRFRWLAPASFALSVMGLVVLPLLPAARRGATRLIVVLAIGTALAALAPVKVSQGRSGGVAAASRRIFAASPEQRLLVVGLDGADWDFIEPLLLRGDLPHLAALRAQGAWGPLKTFEPTLSPVVWTTIVTGQTPRRHGIEGFTARRLRGVDGPLPGLRHTNSLGFAFLYEQLTRRGQVFDSLVTSASRRVPAYWNIATARGVPVSVVSWWATWPAEPVLGYMASDRLYWRPLDERGVAPAPGGATYPESLYHQVAPLVMPPDEVRLQHASAFMDVGPDKFEEMRTAPLHGPQATIGSEFKYFYSMYQTTRRVGLAVLERGRTEYSVPPDTFILFRLVDNVCHLSLHDSELAEPGVRNPPGAVARFGRVVAEAYRAADRALGELIGAFGAGNVIVLSDHGFDLEPYRDARRYDHRHAPDGIFLAAGPAFRAGRVEGLTVNDMMPLLLATKGFPVADDLAGHAPDQVFTSEHLGRHPLRHVATFGAPEGVGRDRESPAAEAEMLERLRALGYLN